jgi:phosphatidylglycerophosphate synthase
MKGLEKRQSETEKERPSYVKAYQAWSVVFFIDPISTPVSRVLAGWKVNPNVVTFGALLAGLSTGVFFALGYWFWAAVVFLFSHLLDSFDGNIARLRKMQSEFGAKLDLWADYLRKPSSFLGIGIYYYTTGQKLFAVLTVVALAGHIAAHKLYGILGVGHCDLEFPSFHRRVIRRFSPRILALYTYFEEFLFLFVIFPLVASYIGLPEGSVWFLWGVLIMTILTMVKLLILWNHRRRGRYDQVYQDWAGTKGRLDKTVSS